MSTKDLAYYLSLSYPIELTEGAEGGYFVHHPDLDGCMAEGGTAEEAIRNLADSRYLWIETRLEHGYPVPEPPEEELSGRISLRMMPSLHARLSTIADRRGISLNLLINTVLAQYAGGMDPLYETLQDLRGAVRQLKEASGISNTTAAVPSGSQDAVVSTVSAPRPR
jgi:predicted RNase H-like HicB family nuclease